MKPREFSSAVSYATEQEADIHGIAFGQHLIDGKVEGRSVAGMKIENGGAFDASVCNFPPWYQIIRSTMEKASCSISLGGYRLESPWIMAPGITMELRVQVPGSEWPLVIDGTHVQWVTGQLVGLAFVRMTETEHQRLGLVISKLMEDESTAD